MNKTLVITLFLFSLFSCNSNSTNNKGKTITKEKVYQIFDQLDGIYIDNQPIIKYEVFHETKNIKNYFGYTSSGIKARIDFSIDQSDIKLTVWLFEEIKKDISIRLKGMPVAHGLGDAGGWNKEFNLVNEKEKTYRIINDGGGQRWASTFTIFPKNNLASVFFTPGEKTIQLSKDKVGLNIKNVNKSEFHFLFGNPKEIYKTYLNLKTNIGFCNIKPKAKLFELGWESWDALGWNTSEKTVKDILNANIEAGYPIKWVVTGSGFWDEGGTTTSFGKYGHKFSNPSKFKTWLNNHDISWMIGLRTNIVPAGGPFAPTTTKRDKNLKVKTFYGNDEISNFGIKNNFFIRNEKNEIATYKSDVFPIVPCYMIDGTNNDAAEWFAKMFEKWDVDGIKEDTMMELDEKTEVFNKPIAQISKAGGLVMARCGDFTSPGTLLRVNDTGVGDIASRLPINYLQYAASGAPNVYSDVAGVHNMWNTDQAKLNVYHTWMLSCTAGLAVGLVPKNWPIPLENAFQKAVNFHYEIVPYLFSAAMDSYQSGYPYTLTPLSIAYPNDKNLPIDNLHWMIGESILATPINKTWKSEKIDIHLPEGLWFDFDTNEEFTGNQVLTNYNLPCDKTPCFIGGKGIIILRKNNEDLYARIYRVNKKTSSTFFTIADSKPYTIKVNTFDLNTANVFNTTSNKKINVNITDSYIEFRIDEGSNYQIK